MKFTKIERHPLDKKFMLYCPVSWLPPFFGTLQQCKAMQMTWERRFAEEFASLTKSRQNEILKLTK